MDLIPRVLVVGLFTAAQGPPDRERVNRVWNELSVRQEYKQLTYSGEAAQFTGTSNDDALLIQLPLIQFRSTARLGVENAADEAQVALKAVARHLSLSQFANLGIKHVFHAPVESKDARAFVLGTLLRRNGDDLSLLSRGGEIWAGLKYGIEAGDSTFTLVIEPLLADNTFLFVDLDAQFPGPLDLDRVRDRAREAKEYADQTIRQYLDTADYV